MRAGQRQLRSGFVQAAGGCAHLIPGCFATIRRRDLRSALGGVWSPQRCALRTRARARAPNRRSVASTCARSRSRPYLDHDWRDEPGCHSGREEAGARDNNREDDERSRHGRSVRSLCTAAAKAQSALATTRARRVRVIQYCGRKKQNVKIPRKSLEVLERSGKREAEDKLKFEAAVPHALNAPRSSVALSRAARPRQAPRILHRGMIRGWSILQPRRGG